MTGANVNPNSPFGLEHTSSQPIREHSRICITQWSSDSSTRHRLSQSRANEQGVKENQTGWKRKHSGTKTSIANPFCIWQTPKQCELWLETMKSSFLMPLDKYLISRSHGGGFIVCKANVEDNKEEIRNSNFRQAEERWFEWAGTMFVGADRPAWVFQKLLIHWDFSGLTENGLK